MWAFCLLKMCSLLGMFFILTNSNTIRSQKQVFSFGQKLVSKFPRAACTFHTPLCSMVWGRDVYSSRGLVRRREKMGEEGEVPLWSCLYHCPGLHLWALWWKGALLPQPRGCMRHGVRHEASPHHDATPASPMDVRKLCDHIINLHSLKAQWFAWNIRLFLWTIIPAPQHCFTEFYREGKHCPF